MSPPQTETVSFYEMLTDAPDFEPLHVPECNIVAFRHIPDALRGESEERLAQFLFDVRRELIHSGEFYIVQANVGGRQALRVTIINPLTTADHLVGLLEAIRRTGRALLAGKQTPES
jgi:L-2,4-diaminobutyrate decarboxylase